jgi:hypothetical protein
MPGAGDAPLRGVSLVAVTRASEYDFDAEQAIRVVPVCRGISYANGARLFVTALECWPDRTVVHAAILRIDPAERREGHAALVEVPLWYDEMPDPTALWLRDDSGHVYHASGGTGESSEGTFCTMTAELEEPIRPDASSVRIGFDWRAVGGPWTADDDAQTIEIMLSGH